MPDKCTVAVSEIEIENGYYFTFAHHSKVTSYERNHKSHIQDALKRPNTHAYKSKLGKTIRLYGKIKWGYTVIDRLELFPSKKLFNDIISKPILDPKWLGWLNSVNTHL